MEIEDVLARRTDLSTFLVHLTRASAETSAKEALKSILREARLRAGSPFGMAASELTRLALSAESQRVVCFTETPMAHLSLLAGEIRGRAVRFGPYGVAITRKQGRSRGVNPVWYVDITPGHDWLTRPLNELVRKAIEGEDFDASEIAKIAPFVEQMGSAPRDLDAGRPGYRKEFWWEREWRHVGHFYLPNTYIVLCPAEDMAELKGVLEEDEDSVYRVKFVDPSWSLEFIIGRLAGFSIDELGPF